MLVPGREDRRIVHDVIYQELCVGIVEDASRDEYRRIMADLADRGAQGILLGCTEIDLLVSADDAPVPDKVLEAYKGTIMVRANPDQLARFLLARDTAAGQPGLQDPIWVIDPLGNLMMQYPAEADGVKVRKDISKLVYSSRIG